MLNDRIQKAIEVIRRGDIEQLPSTACPKCDGSKYYDGPSDMCGCWMGDQDMRGDWYYQPCPMHACRWCLGTGQALTFRVQGSTGDRIVKLNPPNFTCTCPWGNREWLGDACYHALAACGFADIDVPLVREENPNAVVRHPAEENDPAG